MSRRRTIMLMIKSITKRTKEFITRVEADGGLVESPRCVSEKLPKD